MPVYEYKCEICDNSIFEKLVHMMEEVKCKKCNRTLHPLMSKSSFKLKGGGWACSGYSKEKK